jgi:hypothetical protein
LVYFVRFGMMYQEKSSIHDGKWCLFQIQIETPQKGLSAQFKLGEAAHFSTLWRGLLLFREIHWYGRWDCAYVTRVARFSLVLHSKTGKIYQMTTKYTKRPWNILNCCKIEPNVHKIYQHLPLHSRAKFAQTGIFGLKIKPSGNPAYDFFAPKIHDLCIRQWQLQVMCNFRALLHIINCSANCGRASVTRDRCYDFLNIFAKKFSVKISVFDSKQS